VVDEQLPERAPGQGNVQKHVGVPKGAVTSPFHFLPSLTRAINKYLPELVTFLEERELLLSAEKSMVTVFTQDTGEFGIHPGVKISGVQVYLDQTPKLLGVVFVTMYTFTHHIKRQCASARVKVNLLKSLAVRIQ